VLGGGIQNIIDSFEYNSFGQLTRHVNPTGQADVYTYHTTGPQAGYLQSVTVDAPSPVPGPHLSLLTVTARDAFGNMTSRTDPRGHTETFTYNQLDQLVRRTSSSPFNYRTDTYYDAADRVVSVDVRNVDENGAVEANDATSTVYYYDALSRLVKKRLEPDTVVIDTEYVYDANDHVTLERHGEAVNGHQPTNVVRSLYDERDLLFRRTLAESDPNASTTQWDYDKNQNTVAMRAGLEATPEVATTGYDGYDRVVSSTDPMGNLTTRQYDADGNPTFVHMEGELTDGESGPNVRLAETTSIYDEIDRLVRSDVAFFDTVTGSPIGDGFATTKTFYDASSRVIRTEDDNAHGTSTAYDSAGRVTSTVDPAGNTRTSSYDANSNVLTLTELEISDLGTPPQTFVTTYTYDNLDRRSSTTDSGGNEEHDLYDSRSNVKTHFDARGNQTTNAYDGANRLVATARRMTDTGDGSGALTFVLDATRSQDDEFRLVSETDDNGNTTTYQYDALDRLVATQYPDGTSETTTYDVHGNAIQLVDANGSVVTATFDADDRMKTRAISRGAGVLGTTSETWKYDGLSRIVHAQNDGSVVTRKYDSLSSMTQETLQIGAGPIRTLSATFDGANNRMSLLYPSGVTVATTRDALDRTKTITTTGPNVCVGGPTPGIPCGGPSCGAGGSCQPLVPATTSYDYAGPDRVVRRRCCGASPNEQLDVTYDTARRPTRTTHARLTPAALIDDHSYAWDPMSNKASRTQLLSLGTGRADAYAYDSASRLVHAVETPTSLPPVPIDFALDGVGNRTVVTGGSEAGAYSMSPTLPEPADREVNQYTSTPFDGAREYDRNGNLTHKAVTGDTLSYDYRNRMVQITGPGGTHTYGYDAFGRRILADGAQFVSFGDATVEQRLAAGTPKSIYVYGDGIDEIVMGAQDVDGNGGPDRVAYHADDMGNVMAVTNGLGAVLESYDYDNYGKPRFFNPAGAPIAQSAIGNALLFNGRRYDQETGLYDYRTRYLDPRAGRFTSRDSIGSWGDEGNLGNGNAYAGNNPWSAVDPMGMQAVWIYTRSGSDPARLPRPVFVRCPCPPSAPYGISCWCPPYGINTGGGGGGGTGTTEWPLWWNLNPNDSGVCGATFIDDATQRYDLHRPTTSAAHALPLCAQGVCQGITGGGAAAMKNGTVKFFNETKGFGFTISKLCPGHPSCPPCARPVCFQGVCQGINPGNGGGGNTTIHSLTIQAAEQHRPQL
jgi:RHS repeat-associated protein